MFRYCTAFLACAGLLSCAEAGSNGLAEKPPMTWRSWNQFGWYITEEIILNAAKGLVDTSRPIKGKPAGTSLKDLGFDGVGMDEGWAACMPKPGPFPHGRDPRVDPRAMIKRQNVTAYFPIGAGKTAEIHRANADGSISPVVDDIVFPDMKGLVDKVHALGLKAGWYLNDCLSYCNDLGDHCKADECIPGDVKAFTDYGFDNLKVDGCSSQHGIDMFADLINKTGKYAVIENCNNGPKPTTPIAEGGCPHYHQYRTSGDINNGYPSWVSNAQTVAHYATSGLSGPTCWAYPDMLMIGVQGQTPDELHVGVGPWTNFTPPSVAEQRTHFGLWCVLSSPLTLSLDFTNASAVDSVWDIVTNTHALDVNQAWGGSQGTVFASAGGTVDLGPGSARKGQSREEIDNVSVPTWQAWYKPLPGGAAAIFVANHGAAPVDVNISFSDVPGLGPPPPPATCPPGEFTKSLGDVQCIGLVNPPLVDGAIPKDEAACCAACAAAGDRHRKHPHLQPGCDTWQLCKPGLGCAGTTGVPPAGGCYIGMMGKCKNSTNGWVSYARTAPPGPPAPAPAPPAHTKLFAVTDVWAQAALSGSHAGHSATIASHDSVFLTVSPAGVEQW